MSEYTQMNFVKLEQQEILECSEVTVKEEPGLEEGLEQGERSHPYFVCLNVADIKVEEDYDLMVNLPIKEEDQTSSDEFSNDEYLNTYKHVKVEEDGDLLVDLPINEEEPTSSKNVSTDKYFTPSKRVTEVENVEILVDLPIKEEEPTSSEDISTDEYFPTSKRVTVEEDGDLLVDLPINEEEPTSSKNFSTDKHFTPSKRVTVEKDVDLLVDLPIKEEEPISSEDFSTDEDPSYSQNISGDIFLVRRKNPNLPLDLSVNTRDQSSSSNDLNLSLNHSVKEEDQSSSNQMNNPTKEDLERFCTKYMSKEHCTSLKFLVEQLSGDKYPSTADIKKDPFAKIQPHPRYFEDYKKERESQHFPNMARTHKRKRNADDRYLAKRTKNNTLAKQSRDKREAKFRALEREKEDLEAIRTELLSILGSRKNF